MNYLARLGALHSHTRPQKCKIVDLGNPNILLGGCRASSVLARSFILPDLLPRTNYETLLVVIIHALISDHSCPHFLQAAAAGKFICSLQEQLEDTEHSKALQALRERTKLLTQGPPERNLEWQNSNLAGGCLSMR